MLWFRKRQPRLPSFDTVVHTLQGVLNTQRELMADLADLQAAVAANTQAVEDIKAVVAALQASGTDQAAIDAVTAQIKTNNAALEALKPPAP